MSVTMDPQLAAELSKLALKVVIGMIEKRATRQSGNVPNEQLLAGLRQLMDEYQTTDEVVAEEMERLTADEEGEDG